MDFFSSLTGAFADAPAEIDFDIKGFSLQPVSNEDLTFAQVPVDDLLERADLTC